VALILKVVGERIPGALWLDPIAQVQVLCRDGAAWFGSARSHRAAAIAQPDPTEQVERFGLAALRAGAPPAGPTR